MNLAYRKARLAFWKAAGRTAHFWHNQKAIARARTEIIKWKALVEEAEKAKPASYIAMYDSITVSEIPQGAQAVAGYVGGKWRTYAQLLTDFPHAHHVSIAVNASEDALCLDVESGDANPAQAPAWVRRQHARGVKRPIVYMSQSVMGAVENALSNDHINRNEYRLWSAHYLYHPHIDAGADATQWTDKALGRNLDESLCSPSFFQ